MTGTPTLRIAPRQTVAGIVANLSMAWASDADTVTGMARAPAACAAVLAWHCRQ